MIRVCFNFALMHSVVGLKIAPLLEPIKSKTNTNRDFLARPFLHLTQFTPREDGPLIYAYWICVQAEWFIVFCCARRDWTAVITFVFSNFTRLKNNRSNV